MDGHDKDGSAIEAALAAFSGAMPEIQAGPELAAAMRAAIAAWEAKRHGSATATLVYRERWNGARNHATYANVLSMDDDPNAEHAVSVPDRLFSAMFEGAGIRDGDEVEVSVRRTGTRPFGDRRIFNFWRHGYRLETEEECATRQAGQTQADAGGQA